MSDSSVTINGKILSYDRDSGRCEVKLKDESIIVLNRDTFTIDSIEESLAWLRARALSDDELEELMN